MIVAEQLTKRFGRLTAVDAVNFAIEGGDVVGFLGPNEAGKTTSIRMMTGYLRPSSGRVLIGGLDVQQHSLEVRRMVGYLPEQAPIYPEMRVREYLSYRSKLYQVPRRERKAAIDRAISRCWLGEVARRPVGQLSKGFRQRVGLSAALLHDPKVLILDEPTVGLDPAQIREVRRLIAELAGDHTIILSTHILPEVEMTCRSYLMIANGSIRAQGAVANLGTANESTYIIEVQPNIKVEKLRAINGVRDVQSTQLADGWQRLTAISRADAGDLRARIASQLHDLQVHVRELRCDRPTLEAVFMNVLQQAERDHAATQASTQGAGSDAEVKPSAASTTQANVATDAHAASNKANEKVGQP